MGEVRGDTKIYRLQSHRYKKYPPKTLDSLLVLALFMSVLALTMAVVEVDRGEALQIRLLYTGANIMALICLIAIAYLYIMMYLRMPKRKVNQISQVNALINAKLGSKIARTTALLTAALICSFLPAIGITLLGNDHLVFATNSLPRLKEVLVQLNSLMSPILYSYRDRKIRKTVLEFSGMRKPCASQPEAVAPRLVKTNELHGSVGQTKKSLVYKSSRELVARHSSYRQPRMTRSISCNAAIFVDFAHSPAKPHEIVLRRKLSASI